MRTALHAIHADNMQRGTEARTTMERLQHRISIMGTINRIQCCPTLSNRWQLPVGKLWDLCTSLAVAVDIVASRGKQMPQMPGQRLKCMSDPDFQRPKAALCSSVFDYWAAGKESRPGRVGEESESNPSTISKTQSRLTGSQGSSAVKAHQRSRRIS